MTYRPGDHWVLCDRSGRKVRSSETAREWNGLRVHVSEFETRHPQDFVRGRIDRQRVYDPRPEPTDNLLGPLTTTTTAAAVPGATTLAVDASIRFESGDHIGIMLSNGSVHRAIINTVPTTTSLTLTAATKLPDNVSSGALIINYDAVAEATVE